VATRRLRCQRSIDIHVRIPADEIGAKDGRHIYVYAMNLFIDISAAEGRVEQSMPVAYGANTKNKMASSSRNCRKNDAMVQNRQACGIRLSAIDRAREGPGTNGSNAPYSKTDVARRSGNREEDKMVFVT
jgi:hypothetical protein